MSVESRRRPHRVAEYVDGEEAVERFTSALDGILKVSKQEMVSREGAYQKERSAKDRPGPRSKHKKTA